MPCWWLRREHSLCALEAPRHTCHRSLKQPGRKSCQWLAFPISCLSLSQRWRLGCVPSTLPCTEPYTEPRGGKLGLQFLPWGGWLGSRGSYSHPGHWTYSNVLFSLTTPMETGGSHQPADQPENILSALCFLKRSSKILGF